MGDETPIVTVESFSAPADALEAALDAYGAADIEQGSENGIVEGDIIVRDDGDADSAVWLGNLDGNSMTEREYAYLHVARERIEEARAEAEPDSLPKIVFEAESGMELHLDPEADFVVDPTEFQPSDPEVQTVLFNTADVLASSQTEGNGRGSERVDATQSVRDAGFDSDWRFSEVRYVE